MPNETRRKVLPKRGIVQRFPNTFVLLGSTIGACILFSKPIYDIFFYKQPKKMEASTLSDSV